MSRNGGCTGTCINTPGSFRCRCNLPGYKLYTDGKQCVDINECEERNGNCEDLCVNSVGSFRCYCRKQGYILAADKLSCEGTAERFFGFLRIVVGEHPYHSCVLEPDEEDMGLDLRRIPIFKKLLFTSRTFYSWLCIHEITASYWFL